MANHEENQAGAGYEVTDVRTNLIWILLGIVGLMMAVAIIVVIFLMRGLEGRTDSLRDTASPLDTAQAQVPGEPRLQQDPVADKNAIFAEMDERLEEYGAVTSPGGAGGEQHGMVVNIPIERAMELVGTQRVPYRQQPKDAAIAEPASAEEK